MLYSSYNATLLQPLLYIPTLILSFYIKCLAEISHALFSWHDGCSSLCGETERQAECVRTAFPVWDNRIAPVFDVARHVLLVDVESGRIVREVKETLRDDSDAGKALWLADRGVRVLVCGAISRSLEAMIAAYGIHVVPFVGGNLNDIVHAWLSDTLEKGVYALPGCHGRGGRLRFHDKFTGEASPMKRRNQGGSMQRGAQGSGRMGGPYAAGPTGYCACPQCGHREWHERRIPCVQKKCPQCGTAMVRE